MIKCKKAIFLFFAVTALTLCFTFGGKVVKAETVEENNSVAESSGESILTRGIYTKFAFMLNGENGDVWFEVKNVFTLFPSIVTVNLELYRSDTYQEKYFDMELVATNYIYDLDQGETIKALASTEGRQSYWKAHAYYKIDDKDRQEYVSDTILFDANGIRVF